MKLLVAATLLSVPAHSGRLNSHAASSGEFSALTMAMLKAPRLRNRRRLLTRSGLCPDCEKPKTAWPLTFSGACCRVTTDIGSDATGTPTCCMAR
ncbi:hypothetical protein D3C73_1315450 [compost metagenome]